MKFTDLRNTKVYTRYTTFGKIAFCLFTLGGIVLFIYSVFFFLDYIKEEIHNDSPSHMFFTLLILPAPLLSIIAGVIILKNNEETIVEYPESEEI